MLNQLLKSRNIPPLQSRESMLDILQREEYGYIPDKPEKFSWTVTDINTKNFCAGKATLQKAELICSIRENIFSFPVYMTIPKVMKKNPFFIHINFRDNIPDIYMPTEELVDNGFAVLSFCYEDVTEDNTDFTDGLAGVLYKKGQRGKSEAGKIALWAWAAQRVMDFAETQEALDKSRSIICGHSRLGKAALLTAATDERFRFAYSNDSGCSGAAISRKKKGETLEDICKTFPYWFCDNYVKYMSKEEKMPFDQHFLTAAIAPRYVYIASAAEDEWSDPLSEILNCVAIDSLYKSFNKKGFIYENRLPKAGDMFHNGRIGYHMRSGAHYFSREDWLTFIRFFYKHSL